MIIDETARQEAINPACSYIVQAPAGSGKTALLTQRYLRLLSRVDAPEQIVALTFTRKAANEMRERILEALENADSEKTEPLSQHHQHTLVFAKEALQRNHTFNWQLQNQPNRLKIMTIDALCQHLVQAIPLQEKHVPYGNISDRPDAFYKEAARATITYALENNAYHSSIETLLLHVDNRREKLLQLFSDLLIQRAAWLPLLYQTNLHDKTAHEKALAWLEENALNHLRQSLPSSLGTELVRLTRQLATLTLDPLSPSYPLRAWEKWPLINRECAQSLVNVLLTSQSGFRQSFDHRVGLKRGHCDDTTYALLKEESRSLLEQLAAQPQFYNALLVFKTLPPLIYEDNQWQVLQAILTLLPLLAAHLQQLFRDTNTVDFTAVTLEALDALGEEDAPTDLALYLDHRIHHILVDEFQDTSIQQFQLLNKLVCAWLPDDGRTLFVVGDPMQSIYRFRAAEVSLFLRAKQEGIGPVKLIPLELRSNFRATKTMVDWTNSAFQSIFPTQPSMIFGAVPFHASSAIHSATETSYIQALEYPNKREEAAAIIQRVINELNLHPRATIAILVRSRGQLSLLMRLLRENKLPFQGVDIDPLASLPHLSDVWHLTQALLMPANRLAWLSFLRSPWCGLTLPDLHLLATEKSTQPLLPVLGNPAIQARLSKDGQQRVQFIYAVLYNALQCRYQQTLVSWIHQTLDNLHFSAVLTSDEEVDLEQYWRLLERFEKEGQLEDLNAFKNAFNALYSEYVQPARLQIMTIHKSKGLEFDTVILPGLSTIPPNPASPLLRWHTFSKAGAPPFVLMAPAKGTYHPTCPMYDYLKKLETEKEQYELQRLLYVAVTRAKRRLYLFDCRAKARQDTFRELLKTQSFLREEIEKIASVQDTSLLPTLYRLPLSYYASPPPRLTPKTTTTAVYPSSIPRLIGTVLHEILQWIGDYHPRSRAEIPLPFIHHLIGTLGLSVDMQSKVQASILKQLEQLFNDPIGCWIISPHEDEHNEYECISEHQGMMTIQIIDRTFIEYGIRWIIDFKTGAEKEETEEIHHAQVNTYAKNWHKQQQGPIRCGLYYLNNNHWVTWDYSEAHSPSLLDTIS